MIKSSVIAVVLLVTGLLAVERASAQQPSSTFGSAEESDFTLKGDIYFLKAQSTSLPDFDKMNPVGSIYAKELNIPTRSFQEGFPGVTDRFEWFGIDYNGLFYLPKAGRYRFRLTSDDGSQLFIDEKLVIDNDGLHAAGAKEATIALWEGVHHISVKYFQGPAVEIALVLEIARDDGEYEIFNTDRLNPAALATTDGEVRIVLGDGLLFDAGQHTLKPTAQAVLTELKSTTIDKHGNGHIVIDSHTDDTGSDVVNLTLSLKRAQSVADWLASNGVPKKRILVVGYGEDRPRCAGSTDSDRACNRRVEIRLTK